VAGAPASSGTPGRRFLAVVAVAGALAFGLACAIVNGLARNGAFGPVADALFVTPFWSDGVAVAHGALPYRDFPLEYPPLSLPVFVLPAYLPFGGTSLAHYRLGFEVVVTAIGMATLPIVVAIVARLGGRHTDVLVAAGAVAVSPLVVGPLAVSRYDLWPALLAAGAVAALLWDHHRLGFALLALGVLAKLYPALLAPIFVAWTWCRAGRGEALIATAILVGVVAAGLLPFVAIAPDGALASITRSVARPLQVETLGATILIGLHDLVGLPLGPTTYDFESFNLDGSLPSAVAAAQTVVLGAFLAAIWFAAARQPLSARRFVLACAAVICAFVAFGKVLSPQYVLWLIPAVAILGPLDRVGGRALAGLLIVLALTSSYYPAAYAGFISGFELSAAVRVLARNAALVLLAGYLAFAAGAFGGLSRLLPSSPRRRPGPPRPPRPDPPPGRAPSAVE
jgi:hypothetical protein